MKKIKSCLLFISWKLISLKNEWSWDDLCHILKLCLPEDSDSGQATDIQSQLEKCKFNFQVTSNEVHVNEFISKVLEIENNFEGNISISSQSNLSKIVIRNISESTQP